MDPSTIKPKHKGTKLLFGGGVLEKLSRTHIAVPIATFLTYSAAMLYWSIAQTSLSPGTTISLFCAGLLAFTWIEYATHRYVFHMRTFTRLREKLQYTIHGVHHEFPKDKSRLAMPPLLSATIATVLLFLLRVILGDLTFGLLPGMMTGYAMYLMIHYVLHAYEPPKNFFRILWTNHSIHHYRDPDAAFGVSSPLWDYIYGTTADKQKRPGKAFVS